MADPARVAGTGAAALAAAADDPEEEEKKLKRRRKCRHQAKGRRALRTTLSTPLPSNAFLVTSGALSRTFSATRWSRHRRIKRICL
jgi:hypothetical protein